MKSAPSRALFLFAQIEPDLILALCARSFEVVVEL